VRAKHMKTRCAGCERIGVPMSKEHMFPTWLIKRTGTERTGIRWGSKRNVPALAATLPLCARCNHEFGKELEAPVSKIFDDMEADKGLSDNEAELLVRWLWKLEGLSWTRGHPLDDYSPAYTLRERVLMPLNSIRGTLVLAISLIENIDPAHGDKPMGLDMPILGGDAIFVSGVFSEVAMMVLLEAFKHMVPSNFSLYKLAPVRKAYGDAKFFYPKHGFKDDNDAVSVTMQSSLPLAVAHEQLARALQNSEI
jgi:hypothetical protein